MKISLPLLAVLLIAPACVGAPDPMPIPAPSIQFVRASNAPGEGGEGPVHVVGLPGAVSRAGLVTVTRGTQKFEARSTAAGTFSVMIVARRGDELRFRLDSSEESAAYVVQAITSLYGPVPYPIPGVPPVSSPTGGVVTVRGQSGANVGIVAVNMDTGDATSATTGTDGTFTLQIPGEAGQSLRLYDDGVPLGDPWELTIP
jgi:hypothetical protein